MKGSVSPTAETVGRSVRPRGRSWVQRLLLTANLLLIAASLAAAILLQYAYGRASEIQRVELGRSLTPVPTEAAAGERVLNILLVGSDSSEGLDPTDPVQVGRQGERFGDVIIIAHIDERHGDLALLSFPRDLWLPLAGVNRSDRINRAFEVGGPAMLIDTIEANFEIPIHHYVNVDFAGFQGLVEAVGSVDVYFDTPARDWNVNARPEPRSQTGFFVSEAGCHALDPPTALAYVRSRYYQTQTPEGQWVTDPTSDFGRIGRQQDFLKRLMQRAIDLGARNPFVLADMVDTGLENVAIDESLTPQLLLDLGSAYRGFDPETLQTYSFPVVDAEIDGNQVLQPLVEQAGPVLAYMRGAPSDDPTTVDLSLITSTGISEPAAGAAAIAGALAAAGFDVNRIDRRPEAGGITIRHGPNDRAVADLIAGVLADGTAEYTADTAVGAAGAEAGVKIVSADELGGRSVQIVIGNSPQGASNDLSAPDSRNDGQEADHAENTDLSTGDTTTNGGASPPIGQATTTADREAGSPDNGESLSQPVDSDETACRSR